MKTFALITTLAALALPLGCDQEVSHTRSVDVHNDKVTTKDTVVTEKPGAIQVEKSKTTTDLDNGKTKTQTETQTIPK